MKPQSPQQFARFAQFVVTHGFTLTAALPRLGQFALTQQYQTALTAMRRRLAQAQAWRQTALTAQTAGRFPALNPSTPCPLTGGRHD